MHGSAVRIIATFFYNRRVIVVLNDKYFYWGTDVAGLLHGSLLRRLPFLIYKTNSPTNLDSIAKLLPNKKFLLWKVF